MLRNLPAQGLHDPRDDNGGWRRRSLLRRSRGIPLRSPLLRLAPAHAVVPLSLSLSLVSSSSWCARSLRVCLLLASKDLRFREEKTLFCYSPFSRKYHHLQEPQDPDRELASPRVLCWGSNSSPRWQNYRSSRRRGVSGGSDAPLRPLSPTTTTTAAASPLAVMANPSQPCTVGHSIFRI